MSDIQVAGELVSQSCSFDRSALIIKRTLNWEECRILANMLGAMQVSMQWWAGDLMNYAEGLFGEEYAELFKEWDPGTLSNWKYVSKAIPLSRRREKLTWSHHQTVASLEPSEQTRWLKEAEKNKWTRSDLRKALIPPEASKTVQAASETAVKGKAPMDSEDAALGLTANAKGGFDTITCPFCGQSWER